MLIDVRFAGIGGQGAVTAGKLLAEAAVVDGRYFAVQTASYGAAVRGGPAASNVRVSDQPVMFPWVLHPDYLVALHQTALDAHLPDLKPGGTLIIDPLLVTAVPTGLDARVVAVRVLELAQQAGRKVVGNVVALAALARVSGLISREAVEAAVLAKVPRGTEPLNRRAVELGFALEIGAAAAA
jgi:2-oxoglutarate ferredoxin oxidoreductase subunit gamma